MAVIMPFKWPWDYSNYSFEPNNFQLVEIYLIVMILIMVIMLIILIIYPSICCKKKITEKYPIKFVSIMSFVIIFFIVFFMRGIYLAKNPDYVATVIKVEEKLDEERYLLSVKLDGKFKKISVMSFYVEVGIPDEQGNYKPIKEGKQYTFTIAKNVIPNFNGVEKIMFVD